MADDNVVGTIPAAEPSEDRTEWLRAHHTTEEEQESNAWAQERNQDIEANRSIRQALGHDYEMWKGQIEALTHEERLALAGQDANEIARELDRKEEAERQQKRQEEAQAKQAEQAAENNLAESPQQREVRLSMRKAYEQAQSLDKRIAELTRLNEMRDDPAAKGWDEMDADVWRAAREGNLESFSADIQALTAQKQAALAEAALHQASYHESARMNQAAAAYRPPEQPIGTINHNGQPMPISPADLQSYVQMQMDEQAHRQRVQEARSRYADWDQIGRNAQAAGIDVGPREAAFIQSLPNSADVVYFLCKNPNDTRALAQMSSAQATRALINLSHNLRGPASHEAPRKTEAPKPPVPVSGSARGEWSATDESGTPEEWMHRRNAQIARRRKY